MSALKIRAHIEWKVEIQTLEPVSIIFSQRSFISLAALFVKVIAKMLYGKTCFSLIKYAILCVKRRVFPLPAPAVTKTAPSVCKSAFFCASLSCDNISSTWYILPQLKINQKDLANLAKAFFLNKSFSHNAIFFRQIKYVSLLVHFWKRRKLCFVNQSSKRVYNIFIFA